MRRLARLRQPRVQPIELLLPEPVPRRERSRDHRLDLRQPGARVGGRRGIGALDREVERIQARRQKTQAAGPRR